jgi:hypothetical protein
LQDLFIEESGRGDVADDGESGIGGSREQEEEEGLRRGRGCIYVRNDDTQAICNHPDPARALGRMTFQLVRSGSVCVTDDRASELNDAIGRVARSLSFPIDRVFPIQSSVG